MRKSNRGRKLKCQLLCFPQLRQIVGSNDGSAKEAGLGSPEPPASPPIYPGT